MASLATNVQWGNAPVITASFSYEHRRSGADMQYRVGITINPLTSSGSFFGYPIYAQIKLAGAAVDSKTLKEPSPSTWSSAITYTTAWFTVNNKTSGTTALTIRLYSGSGSSRDQTYTYALAVDPSKSDVSATNGYIGSPLTISITRYSTAFTHTLKYTFLNASGTIATKTSATSVSWTPDISLCNQIPASLQGACTITCETYDGTVLVGSSTYSMALYVPKWVQLEPQAGCAVVSPYNVGTRAESIAAFVQGYSKAEASINAAKISTAISYGATPKSYRFSFEGASLDTAPYRTGLLTTEGTKKITCYITDTRDRTTSIDVEFTVHAYSAPKLSDISIFRCDSDGTANDEGTYISAKGSFTHSSLGGNNTATLSVRYGKNGGSIGEYASMTSGEPLIIGSGNVLADATYVVEMLLIDQLGQGVHHTDYIDTAAVFFKGNDGGTAAGFGKPPERDNVLEVAWDLQTRGDLYIGEAGKKLADFVIEEGSKTVGTALWQYRKWNNGRIEMWSRQDIASGVFDGSNGLYYSGAISLPLPFALGSDKATALVSVHSSGVTWPATVGAWAEDVRFVVGRMYGGTDSLTMAVQVYVAGYLRS